MNRAGDFPPRRFSSNHFHECFANAQSEREMRDRKDIISPAGLRVRREYRRDLYRALTDIALLRPINKRICTSATAAADCSLVSYTRLCNRSITRIRLVTNVRLYGDIV